MVSKMGDYPTYKWDILGFFPHLLTIDPNFLGHACRQKEFQSHGSHPPKGPMGPIGSAGLEELPKSLESSLERPGGFQPGVPYEIHGKSWLVNRDLYLEHLFGGAK